jgi:CheY-like chemotaxis protein
MFPRSDSKESNRDGGDRSSRPPLRRRVVVADDDREMARGLKLLLEIWGCEVSVAHDGPSALSLTASLKPDVALIDIALPRLNGLEVATQLRRTPGRSGVFLVALTGYGGEEHRQISRKAGFDEHLVKPVEPDVLRALLQRVRTPTAD